MVAGWTLNVLATSLMDLPSWGSLQESNRCVRQTGTDANSAQAASRDGFVLSGRSSSGAGASVVSHA